MKLLEVICARLEPTTNIMHVVKEVEMPDGSRHLNLSAFHPETLSVRAAQFDTTDLDALVEVMLYSDHVEEDTNSNLSPAAALSLHRGKIAVVKSTLTKTLSKVTASETKVDKLTKAGVPQEYIDAAAEDPIEVIKRHCQIDDRIVKLCKREAAQRRSDGQQEQGNVRKVDAKFEVLRQRELISKTKVAKAVPKVTHVKVTLHKNKRVG